MIIKSIIVEDKDVYSRTLKKLLRKADGTINVVAVATTIDDALDAINKHHPDLLFLDIQLHENDQAGFEILSKLSSINFYVIFTTAHVDNNILKIRNNGLHYIIKPYVEDELSDALKKFWDKKNGSVSYNQIKKLLDNLFVDRIDEQVIWLRNNTNRMAIKAGQILYCETSTEKNDKTKFYYMNEAAKTVDTFISNGLLGEWQEQLVPLKFCRIHKSYLVNYKQIKSYSPSDRTMEVNGIEYSLPISREGKKNLDDMMNG